MRYHATLPLFLLFPSIALAQPPRECAQTGLSIRPNEYVKYPDGKPKSETAFREPELVRIQGDRVDVLGQRIESGSLRERGWFITAAEIEQLQEERSDQATLAVRWSGKDAGTAPCVQRIASLATDEEEGQEVTSVTERSSLLGIQPRDYKPDKCGRAGRDWLSDIKRQPAYKDRDVSLIVFLQDNAVCHFNRDYGVVGDPIFVGVFTRDAGKWDEVRVEFEPCSIEPETPQVYVSGELSAFLGREETEVWNLRTYLPRECFNQSVNISLAGRIRDSGRDASARYTLNQFSRYRGTIQLGVLFTDLQDQQYGLRVDDEGNSRIFNKGPVNTGPRYFASLVVYGILKYIPALVGGERYLGRDIVHDTDILDRIGGVLGVGLDDIGDSFVAGFAFDVAAGINLIGTWESALVNQLAGAKVGDIFAGNAEDMPTKKSWESNFALGLSLDLAYVTNLFKR